MSRAVGLGYSTGHSTAPGRGQELVQSRRSGSTGLHVHGHLQEGDSQGSLRSMPFRQSTQAAWAAGRSAAGVPFSSKVEVLERGKILQTDSASVLQACSARPDWSFMFWHDWVPKKRTAPQGCSCFPILFAVDFSTVQVSARASGQYGNAQAKTLHG